MDLTWGFILLLILKPDYIDLGPLKGNIRNQNYQLPSHIDLLKYKNVHIWYRAFSILFGNAQLT